MLCLSSKIIILQFDAVDLKRNSIENLSHAADYRQL